MNFSVRVKLPIFKQGSFHLSYFLKEKTVTIDEVEL